MVCVSGDGTISWERPSSQQNKYQQIPPGGINREVFWCSTPGKRRKIRKVLRWNTQKDLTHLRREVSWIMRKILLSKGKIEVRENLTPLGISLMGFSPARFYQHSHIREIRCEIELPRTWQHLLNLWTITKICITWIRKFWT